MAGIVRFWRAWRIEARGVARAWSEKATALIVCSFFVLSVLSDAAVARGVPCSEVFEEEAKAAAMMAERQISALWSREGQWSLIGYRFGGAAGAKSPLALPSGGAAEPVQAIAGVLAVEDLSCAIYEIGPPRAYVVQFVGRGLRFREGQEPWSPPVPRGVLHALAVRQVGGQWIVGPMPGARLSFPDDAVLFRLTGPTGPPLRAPAKVR